MRSATFLIFLLPIFLHSNPRGHTVVHGSGTIKNQGDHLEVTTSDRAILHWNEFSIGKVESTTFIQPKSSSVVLNRVIGKSVSELQGSLTANGQVILVNPNGVLITRSGIVDTAAFIASALDVFEESFIKNKELQFSGKGKGVINFGKITAFDGDVALIGFSSENHGTIEANGSVSVIGSEEVFLKPKNSKYFTILTKNIDQKKLAEEGNPYAKAINLEREDDALNTVTKDGQTFLVSSARVTGKIYAKNKDARVSILADEVFIEKNAAITCQEINKGGTILLGGSFQGKDPNIANASYTHVGPEVILDAKAEVAGSGGKVIVWSDGSTYFHGTADVSGRGVRGDGGLVEISGKKGFWCPGKTLRLSENGKDGKLLFDPDADVVIHQSHYHRGAFHNGRWRPTDNKSYIEIGNHFTAGTLLYELAQGDVTIQTEGTGFPDAGGNISINDDLIYHLLPGHDLIFQTKGDLTLNASMVNTGPGDIVVDSCKNLLLDASIAKRDLLLSAQVGKVWIKSVANDLKLVSGKYSPAIIGTYIRGKPGKGQVLIDHVGHDLILKGGEREKGFAMIGTYRSPSTSGNISIQRIGNDLLLEAGKGFCQIGHGQTSQKGDLEGNITIASVGGNVNINSSAHAKAHIGHGSLGEHAYDQKGNIAIEYIGGDLNLSANGKYAQIGHVNQAGKNGSKLGDVFIYSGKDVHLRSGRAKEAYALIGHGGVKGTFNQASIKGSIVVNANRDIFLKGSDIESSEKNGFVAIGFALEDIHAASAVDLCAPTYVINAKNDIIIRSGNSSDAVIGAHLPLKQDTFSLSIKQLQLNAGNTLFIEGYDGKANGDYSEAVLGFRCDPTVPIEQYKQRLGLLIHGEEGVVVQGGAMSQGQHPAFIRGLERWTRSIITSEKDIVIYAEDHGMAGIFHNGPIKIESEAGGIEILSAKENDAFIEVTGNNLDLIAKDPIHLKDKDMPSGKINIKIDASNLSPSIFHGGTLYREKDTQEDPIRTISITHTNFNKAEEIHLIKSTPDLIFLGTYHSASTPLYSLLCNSQVSSSYYQDSTIQATYEANILVSEFLFRLTPTLEYLGYKERFSLYFDEDTASFLPERQDYYIRRPYLFLKGLYQAPLFW